MALRNHTPAAYRAASSSAREVSVFRLWTIGISLFAIAFQAGCQDRTPPPARVVVPAPDQGVAYRDQTPGKPLPPQEPDDLPPPPFNDAPLVNQRPPEQDAFVDAYRHVGRPRILVFVNRSLEGQVLQVSPNTPIRTDESRTVNAAGAIVQSKTTETYLRPGQYDEASAKSIDYEAMENILTDWLGANGQVQIVSPLLARQRLTDEQFKDLQSGRPRMLGEVARQLDADVLIQAQAHPTRQTPQGLQIRLIAEAVNVKGGESIGRAVVDIPPPLDKPQMNTYTRFLARKLMDGMIQSWEAFGPPAGDAPRPTGLPGPANTPASPAPPVETAPPQTAPSQPPPGS